MTSRRVFPAARALTVALLAVLFTTMVQPGVLAAGQGSVTLVRLSADDHTPLPGGRYRLNLLEGVDPMAAEQLHALVRTDPNVLADGGRHPLGPTREATGDARGEARFTGLTDGVYLVRETPSRAGDVAYSLATPFLVAIRSSEGPEETDVVVQVKHEPLHVDIRAHPTTVLPGARVDLSITGTVPAPDVRGKLYRYDLVTVLDRALRHPRPTGVVIRSAAGRTALAAGTHYTWSLDPSTNALVVHLTDLGLTRLAAARADHPETRVELTIRATVAADAAPGQRLTVRVGLFTDGWSRPTSGDPLRGAPATADTAMTVRGADSTPIPEPSAPSSEPSTSVAPAPTTPASDPPTTPPTTDGPLARAGATLGRWALPLSILLVVLGIVVWRRSTDDEDAHRADRPA